MIHGISTKLGGNPNLFESKFVYRKNGKFFVDLKAHIRNQLQESGIQSRRIDTYPLCTYNEKDLLHSYRRDKEKSGRMFSVIGMRQ
jgi:copper oxidase (laccase) domain-containing protein